MARSHLSLTGVLLFLEKKIIFESQDIQYFVRLRSLRSAYVHGDIVHARIVKRGDTSRMAEVEVGRLLKRSRETLLARYVMRETQIFLEVLREYGSFEQRVMHIPPGFALGDIVSCRFLPT